MVCWLLYITIVNVISTMLGGADDGYEGKIKGILFFSSTILLSTFTGKSTGKSQPIITVKASLCVQLHPYHGHWPYSSWRWRYLSISIHWADSSGFAWPETSSSGLWHQKKYLSTTWAWDPWYFSSTKYFPFYLGLMSSTTRWVDPILHKRYLNVHLKGTIDHGRYRPKGISLLVL